MSLCPCPPGLREDLQACVPILLGPGRACEPVNLLACVPDLLGPGRVCEPVSPSSWVPDRRPGHVGAS